MGARTSSIFRPAHHHNYSPPPTISPPTPPPADLQPALLPGLAAVRPLLCLCLPRRGEQCRGSAGAVQGQCRGSAGNTGTRRQSWCPILGRAAAFAVQSKPAQLQHNRLFLPLCRGMTFPPTINSPPPPPPAVSHRVLWPHPAPVSARSAWQRHVAGWRQPVRHHAEHPVSRTAARSAGRPWPAPRGGWAAAGANVVPRSFPQGNVAPRGMGGRTVSAGWGWLCIQLLPPRPFPRT